MFLDFGDQFDLFGSRPGVDIVYLGVWEAYLFTDQGNTGPRTRDYKKQGL